MWRKFQPIVRKFPTNVAKFHSGCRIAFASGYASFANKMYELWSNVIKIKLSNASCSRTDWKHWKMCRNFETSRNCTTTRSLTYEIEEKSVATHIRKRMCCISLVERASFENRNCMEYGQRYLKIGISTASCSRNARVGGNMQRRFSTNTTRHHSWVPLTRQDMSNRLQNKNTFVDMHIRNDMFHCLSGFRNVLWEHKGWSKEKSI